MKFDKFITKVEEVLDNHGSIYFSKPDENNGDSFGVIEESNLDGVFIAGEYHYIGDGDTAMSDIGLFKNVLEAFEYIWEFNSFDYKLGSYKDYNFRFDMVEGLDIDNCYYVLNS